MTVLRLNGLSVSLAPEAEELKESALTLSAPIARVTNAAENQAAVDAQLAIRTARNRVESDRMTVKAPVLDLCRAIDRTAKDYDAELLAEEVRLGKLRGDYETHELARLKSEEAARMQCLTDIERQREAELAQAQNHDQRDEIQERYSNIIASSVQPAQTAERPKGATVREDWSIEVVNPWLLAKDHPNCVRIEPRLSEIKLMLDHGLKVSGVKAEKKVKAGVRVGKEKEALTV